MYKWFALQFVGLHSMQNNENWENESPSVSPLSYFLFSPPGSRYASHAPYADATHAPWYRHAPGYEHDAWGAPSSWHPHEHGASRFAPSRPVTGWSAEDGSAESRHGAAAGGESQAAGEDNRCTYLRQQYNICCCCCCSWTSHVDLRVMPMWWMNMIFWSSRKGWANEEGPSYPYIRFMCDSLNH